MHTAEKVRSNYDIELDIPTRSREQLKFLKEEKKVQKQTTFRPIKNTFMHRCKLLFAGAIVFCMAMVLISRDNLINAKNLEIQKIEKEYNKIKAEVSLAQIQLERKISLSTIEAYAKQKLGMQKPTKSQIIYIDTRDFKETK